MTHAALKDPLPCPFCGGPGRVEKSNFDGYWVAGCPGEKCEASPICTACTADQAIAAWNRRAALSAMEGEAVRDVVVDLPDGDNRKARVMWVDRTSDPMRVCIVIDTPPPQQAAPQQESNGLSLHGDTNGQALAWQAVYSALVEADPEFHSRPGTGKERALASVRALATQPQQAVVSALEVFRISGGDVECCPSPTTDEALRCLRDLRDCYDENLTESLATNPTPSPAPQGGTCDGLGYVVRYHDPYKRGDVSSPEDAPCPDCATPPQPEAGGGVTEAMVERARAAYKAKKRYFTGDYPEGAIRSVADMNRNDDDAWHDALTAALAPKEAGHG